MKKTLILSSVLVICAAALLITNTYGLFETKAKATTQLTIGKWKIILNATDVTLKQSVSFNDFIFTGSTHTEEGYFAPGSTGTFEVEMDLSNCDTSVEYSLSFDTTQFINHPNIEYKIIDEDTNEEPVDGVLHGVVKLSDSSKIKKLKVQLIWHDIEENNENDNELIGKSLDLIINSDFKQYTGE